MKGEMDEVEPRFLDEYVDELQRLGSTAFRKAFPRPVLVGIGLIGGMQDRQAGDMRNTMRADQLGEMRKPTSIQFRVFPLRKSLSGVRGPHITLGRGSENDLIIAEYSLSASHCGFTYNAQHCEIIDFESRNGTNLNGETLEPGKIFRVKDKATLVLGRLKFRFLFADSLLKLVESMPQAAKKS
jgi:hypothetical protein